MPVTQDTEIETLLGRLTDEIRLNSNDSLVGLYVYDSLVTGDFDKDRSDIDLLAVVDTDIEGDTFDRLGRMQARIVEDLPAWQDRIERLTCLPMHCGISGPRQARSQSSALANCSTSKRPKKIGS